MADTAAAQLRRILAVIPRFADDEDHDLEEVAALAGTNRRQIIKDFESITDRFDVPGHLESVQILVGDKMVAKLQFGVPADWRDENADVVETVWRRMNCPPLVSGHMHYSYESTDGVRILDINEPLLWPCSP